MTAKDIFDACWARYRRLREWVADSTGAVRSVDYDAPLEGYRWRPDRARACEYIADFERIGRHALRRASWKGRRELFEAYFVRGADYKRAVRMVGVAEGTFDYWYQEVRRAVGAEFSRAGLFPPSKYFQARMAAPEKRAQTPRRKTLRPPRAEKKLAEQRNPEIERDEHDVAHQA